MRGVLRKTEKKKRVCRATSEVAMGRQQDGSRKTLSKEVGQGKKDHWAALPSLSLFFSSILCFACRHIWSIWQMRLLERDRDEFFLWNSDGDGGYL